MLPVYIFDAPISLSQLDSLPRCQLERDYAQQETNIIWEFILALDQTNFAFAFFGPSSLRSVASMRSAAPPPGTFVEGLWEKNVFEVFLATDHGTRYQELQLSPDGAWWAALFSAPRQRIIEAQNDHNVEIRVEIREGAFSAGLVVPRSAIGIPLSPLEQVRGNVCTCFREGTERKFLSYLNLGKGKPDFHQPGKFQQLLPIFCYGSVAGGGK